MRTAVVAIDGPAGVGKSTVSKDLATVLSYRHLDTGSLYRAVAWQVMTEKIPYENAEILERFLGRLALSLVRRNENTAVFLGEQDVSMAIREESVGMLASTISAIPAVRQALLPVQREIGKTGGLVAEGRDMGTVVFPRADVKFFLTASLRERAQRRRLQLAARGESISLAEVERELFRRDEQDANRSLAPLKPASDALIVDTTDIGVKKVVSLLRRVVEERLGVRPSMC
ncbi:MAG: (d)CMP kinase [Deltaproteobacteria bacterium]|nr:(d)CMP kinase [Deltaproteobacteria bacterium]